MYKNKNIKTKWNYTNLAKNYDLRADYSTKIVKKILKKINCKKYYPVADIGAGTGKLTKILCANRLIVSAVEPNNNMRKFGEKNTKNFFNLNWTCATAEQTNLKSQSIFCVFFGSSFNTLNYEKAYKEIKRILIKNGYICLIWNHRNLNNLHQKEIEKIIKHYLPNFSYGDRRYDYRKLLSTNTSLKNITRFSQRFSKNIDKKDFVNAWKSHGTLMRNCKSKNEFDKIIKKINNYINSLKKKTIKVPYDSVAYIARLK